MKKNILLLVGSVVLAGSVSLAQDAKAGSKVPHLNRSARSLIVQGLRNRQPGRAGLIIQGLSRRNRGRAGIIIQGLSHRKRGRAGIIIQGLHNRR